MQMQISLNIVQTVAQVDQLPSLPYLPLEASGGAGLGVAYAVTIWPHLNIIMVVDCT